MNSQDPKEWPIIEPLPSYGRGRERLGGRHISLIHGNGIRNVIITGKNLFLFLRFLNNELIGKRSVLFVPPWERFRDGRCYGGRARTLYRSVWGRILPPPPGRTYVLPKKEKEGGKKGVLKAKCQKGVSYILSFLKLN